MMGVVARDFAAEARWVNRLIERQRDPETRCNETARLIRGWMDSAAVHQWRTDRMASSLLPITGEYPPAPGDPIADIRRAVETIRTMRIDT